MTEKINITTYTNTMVDAERKLDEAIKKYNDAVKAKNLDDMAKFNNECGTAKELYNDNARLEFYATCINEDDPLLEAVKRHQYQGITFRDKKVKDTDFVIREKAYTEYFVQLAAFKKYAEQYLGKPIGVDEKWLFMITKFTQLMTFYACKELNIDPKSVSDTYFIREIEREIDRGKTPTSKTQIQKQLQIIVTAMLGEGNEDCKYNVTSHDAAFVRMRFCKKSRAALSVTASSPKEMCALIAQVCHRIVLNKDYRIEYREIKNK